MGILEDLADEAAIRKLALRYAWAVDNRDPDALQALFTRDVVFERPPLPVRGYDDIRATPARHAKLYRATFHGVLNHLIELDGDTATGEVYCIAHHMVENPNNIGTGYDMRIRYEDRYRRCEDGKWRMNARRVNVLSRNSYQVSYDLPNA